MMLYLSLASLSRLDCLSEHFVFLGGVSATYSAEVYRCRITLCCRADSGSEEGQF